MTCSQFFLIARLSDASTSTCPRNCRPFDCPSLPQNTMDPELSAIQWLVEERLLAIHDARDEWINEICSTDEDLQAHEKQAIQSMLEF
jgi:hypothetical protein